MTIKEIKKLFKDNGLNIEKYGLGSVCPELMFGYIYKNGLEICTTLDADYRPWETTNFSGTEEEFVKQWVKDCYYNSYLRDKHHNVNILFECLYHMLFPEKYPNTKVRIRQCTDGRWQLDIDNAKDLVIKIESVCTPMINYDKNMWRCEVEKLLKGYLPTKIFYSNAWKSEFKVFHDKYGVCLIPTENTSYETLMKYNFYEWRMGCYRLDFENPKNYHHTWDEVDDVIEYRGVLALVFIHNNGKYEMHPALGTSSAMAMDSLYHELGYGQPEFIKEKCHCGHIFYYWAKNIPNDEKYECICPKCNSLLIRKKV